MRNADTEFMEIVEEDLGGPEGKNHKIRYQSFVNQLNVVSFQSEHLYYCFPKIADETGIFKIHFLFPSPILNTKASQY